jgi:hypothetical protein
MYVWTMLATCIVKYCFNIFVRSILAIFFFSFWTQPQRIRLNQLTNSCFDFLGYLSSVPINTLLVRNQMLENSFLIDTRMKKFDTTVLATPLVGSLSKAQFYTGSRHPISKPVWTDLSDWDILDRFVC